MVFATGSGVAFTPWVLAVPFVILEVMLLGLGVGIIVSSLTTKYRDLAIAVGFGVQLWMYASPVVYPLSMLDASPRLRVLVQLNPMTSPIEIFRMATLGTGTVTMFGIVYSLVFTAAALVLGVVLFSRIEKPLWIPSEGGRIMSTTEKRPVIEVTGLKNSTSSARSAAAH